MKMPSTYAGLIDKAIEIGTNVLTLFSVLSSEEQDKRYRDLIRQTKTVQFFECEGVYFRGNRSTAAIQFMLDNPQPSDFLVWLQKNYQTYIPA